MSSAEARLASILTALGKAVESGYAWSVYPSEAKTLLAEIERLRAEAELLRTGREAARCYADRVEAEVVALRGERAAVVAWLRAQAKAWMETYTTSWAFERARCLDHTANAIESGEHRREEAK
jgi:hypothetical protein